MQIFKLIAVYILPVHVCVFNLQCVLVCTVSSKLVQVGQYSLYGCVQSMAKVRLLHSKRETLLLSFNDAKVLPFSGPSYDIILSLNLALSMSVSGNRNPPCHPHLMSSPLLLPPSLMYPLSLLPYIHVYSSLQLSMIQRPMI